MTAAPFVWNFELAGKAVETDDDGAVYFSGVASDYNPDRDDEYVARTGLEAGLRAYMASNPVVLLGHDWSKPIGRVIAAHIDSRGLHIKARLDPATDPASWQADVLAKVKSGTLCALSIGGRFFRDRPGVVTRVDLMEISLASVGKNPNALVASVGKAYAATWTPEERKELRAMTNDPMDAVRRHRARKQFEADQAQRVDRVEIEHIELSASELQSLVTGDLPRDRHGEVIVRDLADFVYDPGPGLGDADRDYLTPQETQALYGIEQIAPPEPSPEDRFRAAQPTKLDKIRDALRKLDGGS